MRHRRNPPRTSRGTQREAAAAEVLERRYRRLLAWYPAGYRAANAGDMLGVALARSTPGQRWPEPGEAVSLIVSGTSERLGMMLRRPDQRDTAAVLTIAGPILLAAAAARTVLNPFPFLFPLAVTSPGASPQLLATAIASAAWWVLVALAAMLGWRRAAAAGACLGAAGQATVLALVVSGYPGALMVSYWQAAVALAVATSALGSMRSQGRPLSWRAVTALVAGAAILAAWPAAEAASVTYTPITANSGLLSSPLTAIEGWPVIGLYAGIVILMLAAVISLRPAVRRRSVVVLLPAFVTTMLVCWGFQGWLPNGIPFGPLTLRPGQWADLVGVPVAGLLAGLLVLRLYERRLRSARADDGR